VPPKRPTFDLKVLDRVARALAEATDFKEVKSLRDKAEAARQYAKNAAMGLKIQNKAAELKLRAERRAGELLSELVPHGGNRRSSRHDADLKLSDLGIDSSQSSRWRREAAVPEVVFEQYVALADKLGHDITSQGLLKLGRRMMDERNHRRTSETNHRNSAIISDRIDLLERSVGHFRNGSPFAMSHGDQDEQPVLDLLAELANHQHLLADLLEPICENRCESGLHLSQVRLVARLLAEMKSLIRLLKETWIDARHPAGARRRVYRKPDT
jgi:hypothetical protein